MLIDHWFQLWQIHHGSSGCRNVTAAAFPLFLWFLRGNGLGHGTDEIIFLCRVINLLLGIKMHLPKKAAHSLYFGVKIELRFT